MLFAKLLFAKIFSLSTLKAQSSTCEGFFNTVKSVFYSSQNTNLTQLRQDFGKNIVGISPGQTFCFFDTQSLHAFKKKNECVTSQTVTWTSIVIMLYLLLTFL